MGMYWAARRCLLAFWSATKPSRTSPQWVGAGTAAGIGAGAAMAADELKVCAFGVPSRIPRRKAAITTVNVKIFLLIFPHKLEV